MKFTDLKFTVEIDSFDILLVFLTVTATVSIDLLIAKRFVDKG